MVVRDGQVVIEDSQEQIIEAAESALEHYDADEIRTVLAGVGMFNSFPPELRAAVADGYTEDVSSSKVIELLREGKLDRGSMEQAIVEPYFIPSGTTLPPGREGRPRSRFGYRNPGCRNRGRGHDLWRCRRHSG